MKEFLFYRKSTCFRIIFILAVSFLMPSVYAQDDVEKKEPQPIPTADIIKKSDSMITTLKQMNTLIDPQEIILNIEEEYPEYLKLVDDFKNDPDMQRLDELATSKLGDLKKKWMSHRAILKNWEDILVTRSENLEKDRISLLESKRRWQITNDSASDENVPNQMLIRIKDLLKEFDKVQAKYRKRLNVIISLQNTVSDKLSLVNSTISHIDELLRVNQEKIFSIDSESLWEAIGAEEEEPDFTEYLTSNFQRHAETLLGFYEEYKYGLIVHMILLITLLAFLLSLRHFGTKLIMDKEAAEISREILNHPYSVALLVTLLLTPELYPRAPDLIGKLAQIMSLIPVLRLIPVLYIKKIHKVLIIFIGIYFLNLIYVLSSEQALIHRIYLLFITFLSLAFLIWIIKGKWLQSIESSGRLIRFSTFLIYLFAIFIIISVIANFIGNVSLASLLTTASMSSIYLSFIMLAGSLVLIGLLNLVLSTKVAYLSRIVRVHPQKMRKNIANFIYLIAVLIWLSATMKMFTIYSFFYDGFITIISERLQIGSVDISLGDFIVFFLAIYASVWISRFIRFILEEDVLVRMKLPRGVSDAVSMLTNYIIIGLGLVIALSASGFDLTRFAILFGALGVGIGFGLQNVVNNFISGLILIFERPIQLGDTIAQGELYGNVTRIGIRSSTIRTFDGAEVIVPNSNLISNEVTNWTLSDRRRRVQILVGIAYGTDPEKVLNILRDTIKNNPDILENPEPLILFREFGESSLNFDIRFWTDSADAWLQLQSDVTVEINNALKKAGIEIPFPQRDLHLRSVDKKVIGDVTGEEKMRSKK